MAPSRAVPAAASALGLVELETTAAYRGALSLSLSVLSTGLTEPDVVETVRADFAELLRSTTDGAEQSWSFDQSPGSQGDLTIEVTPTGVTYVGTAPQGLRFERTGELTMSYSHGVWIDADGDRWSIPATYSNGHISLTVPSSVMAVSSYPAVLDPQLIVTPIGGSLL